MKLTSTRQEYEFSDEGGYGFTVIAEFDPEWGWSARVGMGANGMKTAEDAIHHLAYSANAFLRQLKVLEVKP